MKFRFWNGKELIDETSVSGISIGLDGKPLVGGEKFSGHFNLNASSPLGNNVFEDDFVEFVFFIDNDRLDNYIETQGEYVLSRMNRKMEGLVYRDHILVGGSEKIPFDFVKRGSVKVIGNVYGL